MKLGIALTSRLRFALEVLALAIVAAIAFQQASRHFAAHYGAASFYQRHFGLAVNLACGGDWNSLAIGEDARLDRFLRFEARRLECADTDALRRVPTTQFQEQHRYLMSAVGLWWKLQGGPDWSALRSLFCILFVVSSISAYALLRLRAPPLLAGAGAVLFAASEVHLANLVHLRDYSKAPFLLAGAAATLLIVYHWRRRLLWLAAASVVAGLAAGIGLGFRQDLLLLVPFTLLSIALFGGTTPAADLGKKLTLIAAFLAAFAIAGIPVLKGLQGGANTSHVILLGLMTPFDRPLGVRTAYYEFGDHYNDVYANALINAGHQTRTGDAGLLEIGTAPYEEAGFSYLRALVKMAPGDFGTRAAGATLSVLLYDYGFMLPWRATGTLLLTALIVLLAHVLRHDKALRSLTFPVFVMCYFSATAFLQFQERHFFHLAIGQVAILTWAAEALRREALALAPVLDRGPAFSWVPWRASLLALGRNAVVLALIPAAACVGLFALRQLQTRELVEFFDRVADPLGYTGLAKAEIQGMVRYTLEPGSTAPKARRFDYDYVMARFDASKCDFPYVTLELRYDANDAFHDLTHSYPLSIDADTRILVPVFGSRSFRFRHIGVPAEQGQCVSFVGRRTDRRLEFLPIVRLDENWRKRPAYQTLTIEPTSGVPSPPRIYAGLGTLQAAEQSAVKRLKTMGTARAEGRYVSAAISASASGLLISGARRSEYLLLQQPAVSAPHCSLVIVAEGEILRGGLTIGALTADEKEWDSSVNVENAGSFRVFLASRGKRVAPIIANIPAGLLGSSATVSKFGAVELCP